MYESMTLVSTHLPNEFKIAAAARVVSFLVILLSMVDRYAVIETLI